MAVVALDKVIGVRIVVEPLRLAILDAQAEEHGIVIVRDIGQTSRPKAFIRKRSGGVLGVRGGNTANEHQSGQGYGLIEEFCVHRFCVLVNSCVYVANARNQLGLRACNQI